ncbi:MAG TPA: hypothetical protein VFP97_09775 [Chitinophagaceae bacterium]|nr:hypothetical protein [Chitinophagaceae bacterium]
MKKVLQLLETRPASVGCLLFAIANRIVFTTLYSQIGTDTKIQLTYTQNLLADKGMGVTKYFTHHLDNGIFDTQQMFPPGLSLAIIPFLKLAGNNESKAVLAFDIVAAVLFVVSVRLLGKKSGLSPALNNILILIAGCTQFLFFMSWSSTDAISLCFILLGLTVTIDIIDRKDNISFLQAAGIGILFCLPFFFRYMYLPIAMFLPFSVLASGVVLRNKQLKIAGAKLLLVSLVSLVLLLAFNLYTSGNALFVHDFGRGIFPGQLARWYPFLPASFINLDFAAQLTERISGLPYSRFMFYMEILNPVLFVLLIILLGRYIAVHKFNIAFSRHSLFIVLGAAISICILLLLAYLTLTYKAIPWGLIRWTHSQHARYFAFIYIFIPMLVFVWLQYYGSFVKKIVPRIVVFIALCCMITETLHGVYYNIKIIGSHKDLRTIKDADQGYKKFSSVIAEIKQKYPGSELLISSPDQYYLHAASQMGYKAIFDYENISQAGLKPSSKSILLVAVHQQEAIIMKDYIEKKKPKLFAEIAGTYFYTEEINP